MPWPTPKWCLAIEKQCYQNAIRTSKGNTQCEKLTNAVSTRESKSK